MCSVPQRTPPRSRVFLCAFVAVRSFVRLFVHSLSPLLSVVPLLGTRFRARQWGHGGKQKTVLP